MNTIGGIVTKCITHMTTTNHNNNNNNNKIETVRLLWCTKSQLSRANLGRYEQNPKTNKKTTTTNSKLKQKTPNTKKKKQKNNAN